MLAEELNRGIVGVSGFEEWVRGVYEGPELSRDINMSCEIYV